MSIDSLHDLFIYKLEQQYYVENQLVKELDQMAINATNDQMSQGFADHRDETRRQTERLEVVFEELDLPIESRPHPVLDALRDERTEFEEQITDEDLLNTVYLNAGMMTERIEITAYEGLLMTADQLGYDEAVLDPLEANLDEEKSAYRKLDAMSTASELKSLWNRLTS